MIRWLSALDRKLLRDLWRIKTQAFAIALVIAAGTAVHLLAGGMLSSLESTRDAYYEHYRFADLWAPVVRAPERLLPEIRAIAGVSAAETRVRAPIVFDLPGVREPASGVALSWSAGVSPSVNDVYVAEGRMPEAAGEAAVLMPFAEAHELSVGGEVAVTLHGRREVLRVVGVVLSPEHVFTVAPGQLVPDSRRYGVIWMERTALSLAVDQDAAFNETFVRLAYGAKEDLVITALDRVLNTYGATGAYGRSNQMSDAFVSSEIDQLKTMGSVLPPIFLGVAAFLVNVVVSRIIATQRSGIGLLKAFGYRNWDVVVHYLKLVGIIAALGLSMGTLMGLWLGRGMASLYTEYYSFPFLIFDADALTYVVAAGVVTFAVLGGAVLAVRRIARLGPAAAMTAPPPPDYSKALGLRITKWPVLDQQTRIILRQIVRWPLRAAMTVAGISAAGALLIGTLFFIDSMETMMDAYFNVTNRHDIGIAFFDPRSRSAYHAVRHFPGVLDAEPYRVVSAKLRNENREERVMIVGSPLDAELSRMVDSAYRALTAPPGGLLLSSDLAEKLAVRPGMSVDVEIPEGRRPNVTIPVSAVSTTFIGSGAQMEISDLNRLLEEGANISGAFLTVDEAMSDELYTALRALPVGAGISLQSAAEANLRRLMHRNIGVSIWIYTGFAGLIALGVVYNSVRISFSERARELASLRVLGFSQANVAYLLLGEIAFLTLLAMPLGAISGVALAYFLSKAMSSDLFRLPFVIEPGTFGYTALVVVLITAFSGLMVSSRLRGLDMVSALKTGD